MCQLMAIGRQSDRLLDTFSIRPGGVYETRCSASTILSGHPNCRRTRVIVQQVLSLLRPMYRPGYDYAKAGVMLSALVNEAAIQEDFFASPSLGQDDRAARLMSALDEINRKSPIKVRSARQAGPAAHAMRREHLSPAYTTDWNQLPTVR